MAIFDDKVTTAFELPGQRVVQNCGIVRASSSGHAASSAPSAPGCRPLRRNISSTPSSANGARDAYQLMLAHAREAGGNA